jgi:hypothetical protein
VPSLAGRASAIVRETSFEASAQGVAAGVVREISVLYSDLVTPAFRRRGGMMVTS